jgi:hypothetical protein
MPLLLVVAHGGLQLAVAGLLQRAVAAAAAAAVVAATAMLTWRGRCKRRKMRHLLVV